jgi:hypothetical protein
MLCQRMEKMDEAFPDASVSGFQHLIPHHGGNGRGCPCAGGGAVRGGGVIVEQSEGTRRPHLAPPRLLQALGRVVPEFARLVADSQEFRDALGGR